MRRYRLSNEAAKDVNEIWSYIAEDNPGAARRLRIALLDACRRIAENPHVGHLREDLADPPLRFLAINTYLVIYDPSTDPLSIVRVVHGARNLASLL